MQSFDWTLLSCVLWQIETLCEKAMLKGKPFFHSDASRIDDVRRRPRLGICPIMGNTPQTGGTLIAGYRYSELYKVRLDKHMAQSVNKGS